MRDLLAAEAAELLTRWLAIRKDPLTVEELFAVCRRVFPGVVVLAGAMEDVVRRGRASDPVLETVTLALARFEVTPEALIEAAWVIEGTRQRAGSAASAAELCRELVVEQGFRPWVLEAAYGIGAPLSDWLAITLEGVLASTVPDYLSWSYPAWDDKFR
ncbi:MAG TPA: hypothetical protein DCR14_19190 [Acidimicrobiaceae bacterium]|nr:hypothetical protein [Acidimicrobiaceae bacterium]